MDFRIVNKNSNRFTIEIAEYKKKWYGYKKVFTPIVTYAGLKDAYYFTTLNQAIAEALKEIKGQMRDTNHYSEL